MGEILDIFGIDWRLLLIQAINFAIVLAALWYFLYRPIMRIVEQRQQRIEQGIQDAEAAAAEREEIARHRDEQLASARSEADEIVNAAKERGQEREREILREAEERRNQIINDAQERADAERERAIEESKREIAKLAVLSAEKVLRESKTANTEQLNEQTV
jgi:F-type H+-transporting ATPase subunit b